MHDSRQIGLKGECFAAQYLHGLKYQVLEQNYRCKYGELDIIATHQEFLVFIEVKTRSLRQKQVNPLISITSIKKNKLLKLGKFYREKHHLYHMQPRFDIIALIYKGNGDFSLEHVVNAF